MRRLIGIALFAGGCTLSPWFGSGSSAPTRSDGGDGGNGGDSGDGGSSLEHGLIGLWHFDEASGAAIAKDALMMADGTPSGGVTFGGAGKFGSAATFDGTGKVTIPGMLGGPKTITLSAWVRLQGPMKDAVILNLFSVGMLAGDPTSVGSRGYWVDSGNTTRYSPCQSDVSVGSWHHIAFAFEEQNQQMYVDGIAQISTGNDGAIDYTRGSTAVIGSAQGASFDLHATSFIGDIDEVAVWNRLLSAAEVSQLQTAPVR